jgi:hypothetical protein
MMYTKNQPIFRVGSGAPPVRRRWHVALFLATLAVASLLGASLGRGVATPEPREVEPSMSSTPSAASGRRDVVTALAGSRGPAEAESTAGATPAAAPPDASVVAPGLPPRFASDLFRGARPAAGGTASSPTTAPAPSVVGPAPQPLVPGAPRFLHPPLLAPAQAAPSQPAPPAGP